MKNLLSLALAGILFVNLSACTKACQKPNLEKNKVLRIGTNANFPPFETIDKNGGLVGFDIDLGRELAEQMGLRPEFKEFDFDGLVLALKKGQVDMILSGLSITKSRQEEILMVPYQGKPLTQMAFIFWENIPDGLKSLEDLKRLSDEKKLAISVQSGHFLEGFLREQNIHVKPLAGPPEQIIDIKYKKSLAAALDDMNGKSLVSKHPSLKLLVVELPEDKWDLGYGVGISKSNTELAEKISAAVATLHENGTMSALEKKWIEVKQ